MTTSRRRFNAAARRSKRRCRRASFNDSILIPPLFDYRMRFIASDPFQPRRLDRRQHATIMYSGFIVDAPASRISAARLAL